MSETPRNPWTLNIEASKPPIELGALAKECGVTEKEIQDALIELGCAKPDRKDILRSRPGKSPMRKSVLICSSDDAERVRRHFGVGKEEVSPTKEAETEQSESPEGWPSLGRLRIRLGLDTRELDSCLHEVMLSRVRAGFAQTPFGVLPQQGSHGELFERQGVTYVSPEVAEKLARLAEDIFRRRDASKYLDSTRAMQELGTSWGDPDEAERRFQEEIEISLQQYPWLTKEVTQKSYTHGGDKRTFYSRDLISFIRKLRQSGDTFVTAVEEVPEGYVSERDVVNMLQLFPSKLQKLRDKVLVDGSTMERPVVGLFKPGSTSRRIAYFYSPELVKKIEELKAAEDALREENVGEDLEESLYSETEREVPMGYLSKRESLSVLDITPERFARLAEEAAQHHPELVRPTVTIFKTNHSLRPRIFYSQEFVKVIGELKVSKEEPGYAETKTEMVPEGYISLFECAVNLGTSARRVERLVDICLELEPKLKEQGMATKRRGQSRSQSIFYSPELVTALTEQKQIQDELLLARAEEERRILEETITLKEKLSTVLAEVARGSAEAKQFRRVVSLFGGARTVDILYRLYPDFKKLPHEYVQKEVATHLSDHMVSRSEQVIEDLEAALPFLNEDVFKETLFTVLRNYCAPYYSTKKREARERSDADILGEYVVTLTRKAITLRSEALKEIVEEIDEYVSSLLHDYSKPETVVDTLGAGRKFPDLNQIINVKEVEDKRRVLIGDEMGMGKSGSAILSKEYLGLGTAIVVVPGNAVDMWKDYLSDIVSPAGKQIGYFRPGKAPRVLEVQNLGDIDRVRGGEYDYILVSHDRITEESAGKLREVPYEMVIIDEAHKFKNVTEGKRSNALLGMLEDWEDKDTYTVLLSGTPIPNKIRDMAIVLKLLYPERFGHMDNGLLVSSIIKGDLTDLRELLLGRTQMKKLSESIEMPEKEEYTSHVTLSEEERELYDLLKSDDHLNAMERLSALRLFCLNPMQVFPDHETKGSKVAQTEKDVSDFFATKDKLVLFINGYVQGVIRGDNSVLSQIQVPEGVTVWIIDGDVSRDERRKIEQELRSPDSGKILLVVNGGAVDVAVDFSAADGVLFYNEPWTRFDKMQQTSRVYRTGLAHDIKVGTSITEDTVEEGMHYYIEMKYRAVVKLLEGIPLSQLEKSLLLLDEKASETVSIDRDFGLAEEWLQTPMGRLSRFSKLTKGIGEKEFRSSFLEEYGEVYADFYEELETHSFESNTARFVAALIDEYRMEKGLPDDITVLDIASGPEMLRKRMREEVATNVYSLDINPEHFKEQHDRQIVGGFTQIAFPDSSVDYVNLSHALHYSSFRPEKGDYERLIVLSEIARVLKVGGRATINLSHTQRFRSIESLREIADEMGLVVIDSATGMATSGDRYVSPCVTFEKVEEIDLPSTIAELKSRRRYVLYGLRLDTNTRTKKLFGSDKLVRSFTIGDRSLEATLNEEDTQLLAEQELIQEEGAELVRKYGDINGIPADEIRKRGFLRYISGKKSRLVKKGQYSKTFVYVD